MYYIKCHSKCARGRASQVVTNQRGGTFERTYFFVLLIDPAVDPSWPPLGMSYLATRIILLFTCLINLLPLLLWPAEYHSLQVHVQVERTPSGVPISIQLTQTLSLVMRPSTPGSQATATAVDARPGQYLPWDLASSFGRGLEGPCPAAQHSRVYVHYPQQLVGEIAGRVTEKEQQQEGGVRVGGASREMFAVSPGVLDLPAFVKIVVGGPVAGPVAASAAASGASGGGDQTLAQSNTDAAATTIAAAGAGGGGDVMDTNRAAAAAAVKGGGGDIVDTDQAAAAAGGDVTETNRAAVAAGDSNAAADPPAVHEESIAQDAAAFEVAAAEEEGPRLPTRWERAAKWDSRAQVLKPAPDAAYLGYRWVNGQQQGPKDGCTKAEAGRCKALQHVLLLYDLASMQEELLSKQQQLEQEGKHRASKGGAKGYGKRKKGRKDAGKVEGMSLSQEWGAELAEEAVAVQQPLWIAKRRTLGSGTMHGSMVLHVYKTNSSRQYNGQFHHQQQQDIQVGSVEGLHNGQQQQQSRQVESVEGLQDGGQQQQHLCIMQLVPWMVRVWLHTLKVAVDQKVGTESMHGSFLAVFPLYSTS